MNRRNFLKNSSTIFLGMAFLPSAYGVNSATDRYPPEMIEQWKKELWDNKRNYANIAGSEEVSNVKKWQKSNQLTDAQIVKINPEQGDYIYKNIRQLLENPQTEYVLMPRRYNAIIPAEYKDKLSPIYDAIPRQVLEVLEKTAAICAHTHKLPYTPEVTLINGSDDNMRTMVERKQILAETGRLSSRNLRMLMNRMAHEAGHLVLHQKDPIAHDTNEFKQIESEADNLALEVIPDYAGTIDLHVKSILLNGYKDTEDPNYPRWTERIINNLEKLATATLPLAEKKQQWQEVAKSNQKLIETDVLLDMINYSNENLNISHQLQSFGIVKNSNSLSRQK